MMSLSHPHLSIRKQCHLLGVHRSSLYRVAPDRSSDTQLANEIYTIWLELPFYGYRRIWAQLCREGYKVNHKRVQRLMQQMNLRGISPGPSTSKRVPKAKPWPCLLKGMQIARVNQVWVTDITYLRLPKGFVYLVVLLDLYSRYVVSYRLSVTLDVTFCREMVEEALLYAKPEIFHSDQGSQFTSEAVTSLLTSTGILGSMTGKGRCIDNVYVERLWRSVKYEDMLLRDYASVSEARASIKNYLDFYNNRRLHQHLQYQTPKEVYLQQNENPIEPFIYLERTKPETKNEKLIIENSLSL